MASYIWSGPNGGNWSDPANWTPNGVPSAADSALVNLAGNYTIALDIGSIGSLTLDGLGVTITPTMPLTLAGVLDVHSGTFVVNNPITGGTIRPDGGTITYAGGTLDGVTLAGPLDLSAAYASVSIQDGITFTGTSPGQIIDTGLGSRLYFQEAETLNNVAISIGNTSEYMENSSEYYSSISGTALILGPSSTLTTDGSAYILSQTFDNRGSITAATGYLYDETNTTNEGSIAISDGSASNVIYNLISNTGTISVSGTGTELDVYDTASAGSVNVVDGATLKTLGTFDNTGGTITVASGATFDLNSTETDAQLGTINRNGGSLKLGGTLDNTGSTLDITSGSMLDGASLAGIIHGGTVKLDGGTLAYGGGTLDGVTLVGPLDLSAANAQLSITDGIAFAGTAPEEITVTGNGASLFLGGTETLSSTNITLGVASGTAFFGGETLTFGASTTLIIDGGAYIDGGTVDNQGIITAATGTLNDQANITNQGFIAISDGSTSNIIYSLSDNTGIISVSGAGTGVAIGNAVNSGSINVAGSAALTTQGTLDNTSGTITLDTNSTLSLQGTETTAQLGTINRNGGSLTLGGTLDNTGSTLNITSGSLLDGAHLIGTIQGGTIDLDGGTLNYAFGYYGGYEASALDGVTLDGPLDLSAADARTFIENGITFTGGGPEQILDTGAGASLTFDDTETLNDVAISIGSTSGYNFLDTVADLTLGAAGTLTTAGGAVIEGTALDNQGSITAATGYFDDSANITNQGSIAISDGSTNNLLDYLISNTGTISVSGTGTGLTIIDVPGSGSIGATSIAANATLTITNPTSTLGTVSFLDNTGTLSLDLGSEGGGYDGTLDLFQSGNAIDLTGTGYSLNHIGKTLTVSQSGSVVDSFTLAGQDYSNATFTLTEASGDTVVTTDAPCFCTGTLIVTDQGERVVESLEVGDLVVTLQDGVEVLMPIRWLGRRRLVVAHHPEGERVDPIRIACDAVAPGAPARDLFVSPDHALFLDGMLIQARQLVNHMTITHDVGRAVVTYHHVELDQHAVLIADGMPCESYLDGGNRGRFDSQGIVVPLHPPVAGNVQPCAPPITDAAILEPVWQRLAERARMAGYAEPVPRLELDLTPWLEAADGERLLPSSDGLRFALPPGCSRVRLRSASDLPTTLSPWSDDRRRLGVAVSAVVLHRGAWRQPIPLRSLDATAGWWPLETAGDLTWRWSNGDGWIELPEPAQAIEITFHAVMRVSAARGRPVSAAAG